MISLTYHTFEKSGLLNQDSGITTVPIQFLKSHPSTSPMGSLYNAQVATLHAFEVYDYLSSSVTPSDIRSFSPFDDSLPALVSCVDDTDIEDVGTDQVGEVVSMHVWSR